MIGSHIPDVDEVFKPSRATVPALPKAGSVQDVHSAFRRWLGPEYDLDAIDAVMSAAAAEKLAGDPLWLLVISGSGNVKTETTPALAGAGALVSSTITSEGALLSGTPSRDKAKGATGGLLRKIGERGVLVVKDVTSILSMNRETRAPVLAALREIYDGRWERNIGTEGGRTLTWSGRITVVGAVTTAWDSAHAVIASMGDRFVILRMDSTTGRQSAREHAMRNTGHEDEMRAELADVVGAVVSQVTARDAIALTSEEMDIIGEAADVVTLCRTAVDFDYRGDVIDAHAPEAPTRFAKQFVQVVRGAVALGINRQRALRLAIRCARDSMPLLRLAIIEDVATHPHSKTSDIRRRLNKRNTVDRQLQAPHMLGVLDCDEVPSANEQRSTWYYDIVGGLNPDAIAVLVVPVMSPHEMSRLGRECVSTDISGTAADGAGASMGVRG